MLLFSWRKLYKETGGLPTEILRVIRMLTYNQIPNNRKDPIYKYSDIDFSGHCFLAHPELLCYNAYKYSSRDIAIYISLAALRSLPDYIANEKLVLEGVHSPVDPREWLENPSLLPIDEYGNIHFKYEEVQNQTKH